MPPVHVLEPVTWRRLADAHAEQADRLTADRRARAAAGRTHAVEDFLYDYYGLRPGVLRRWHPGIGTALAPADDGPAPHAGWRWYAAGEDGTVRVDVAAFLDRRGAAVRRLHALLSATASRPALLGCFGLHEWAMVYRQDEGERRHALPLRLGRAGTDAVVEAHTLRCTHIDAFRFFTPDAVPRNRLQPTRETQVALEQPGCLHANMDLLRAALELGPLVPGDLLLEAFVHAHEIRRLDMQASPYDVSAYGEPVVAIETPEGRAEYVRRQRDLAERTAPLRARLVEVCEVALELTPSTARDPEPSAVRDPRPSAATTV